MPDILLIAGFVVLQIGVFTAGYLLGRKDGYQVFLKTLKRKIKSDKKTHSSDSEE